MNPNIEVVTNPNQVANLIGPDAGAVDPAFQQTLAQIETDKKKKAEDAAKLAELTEKAKPKPQPLQLTYKWIGTHDCGTEPKTIVVETESGCYATAYCIKDDIQIKSMKVEKLLVPGPIILEKTISLDENDLLASKPHGIISKKERK